MTHYSCSASPRHNGPRPDHRLTIVHIHKHIHPSHPSHLTSPPPASILNCCRTVLTYPLVVRCGRTNPHQHATHTATHVRSQSACQCNGCGGRCSCRRRCCRLRVGLEPSASAVVHTEAATARSPGQRTADGALAADLAHARRAQRCRTVQLHGSGHAQNGN